MGFPQISFGGLYYFFKTRNILSSHILQKWVCPHRNLKLLELKRVGLSGAMAGMWRKKDGVTGNCWQLRRGCCCSVMCWRAISSEHRHSGETRPRSTSHFLTPLGRVRFVLLRYSTVTIAYTTVICLIMDLHPSVTDLLVLASGSILPPCPHHPQHRASNIPGTW